MPVMGEAKRRQQRQVAMLGSEKKEAEEIATLASANGHAKKADFSEIGTVGLNVISGVMNEAYLAELRWPTVWPIYKKILRSDPETSISRFIYTSMAKQVRFEPVLPDDANDDEKRAGEFLEQVLDDLDGGISKFRDKAIVNV